MSVDGDEGFKGDGVTSMKAQPTEDEKPKQEFVSEDDLTVIKEAKEVLNKKTLEAEVAMARSAAAVASRDAARLEHQNQILKVYLKYKLGNNDLVNESDGLITRNNKG